MGLGTEQNNDAIVNGEAQNLTPHHAQTLYATVICWGDYVVDPTPVQIRFVTFRPWVSFPRMRDFPHQNVFTRLVFFRFAGSFDEIWYHAADIEPDYSHMTKN